MPASETMARLEALDSVLAEETLRMCDAASLPHSKNPKKVYGHYERRYKRAIPIQPKKARTWGEKFNELMKGGLKFGD